MDRLFGMQRMREVNQYLLECISIQFRQVSLDKLEKLYYLSSIHNQIYDDNYILRKGVLIVVTGYLSRHLTWATLNSLTPVLNVRASTDT